MRGNPTQHGRGGPGGQSQRQSQGQPSRQPVQQPPQQPPQHQHQQPPPQHQHQQPPPQQPPQHQHQQPPQQPGRQQQGQQLPQYSPAQPPQQQPPQIPQAHQLPQIQQAQQGWAGGMGAHGQSQMMAPPEGRQMMGSQPGMGRQGSGQRGPQLRQVSVEDAVQSDVVTAEPDTPLSTITEKMESEAVGSVVIVDGDEPVGIVTDRSIALCLHGMDDLAECTVDDIAVDDLVTGTTEMSLFDALDQMSTGGVRRLPVVDDDGSLAGIVTLDDILVLLGSEMEKATDVIQTQSPRL